MSQTRRNFLGAAAAAAVTAWGGVSLAARAQDQTNPPPPSIPQIRIPSPGPMPTLRLTPAERMRMNQAQIRKSSARLAEVVGELQKNLAATDTTNVLSLDVIREAEEIERLAREIRNLVRG
jgi:hypothetical protein